MENSAPNHGSTFSHKNECSFRLSGHASPAQRKPNSNSSRRSPVAALQKLGRNCSIYPRFISMLQENFRLANKFPEVSTLAGPLSVIVSQATPLRRERKGLVTLRPSSCRHDRNLSGPIRSALFVDRIRCHGVQLRHNVFSGCQQLIT